MINEKEITKFLTGQLQQEIGSPTSLDDLESLTVQTIRHILKNWLENCEGTDPEPQTRCRECGQDANYISKRVGFVRTKFGLIRYRRAFYLCPHCHQSTCPLDERLNPIESLARLRSKIAAGKSLPVAELAHSWGLGTFNIFQPKPLTIEENHLPGKQQVGLDEGAVAFNQSQDRFTTIFSNSVQSRMAS